jgi:hypothetical protein
MPPTMAITRTPPSISFVPFMHSSAGCLRSL